MRVSAGIVAAVTAGTFLAGCALPRSGPDYGEIADAGAGPLPYHVVPVTAEVVTWTDFDERRGFDDTFLGEPVTDTNRFAPSDVLALTVWENVEEGLFSRAEAGGAPFPNMVVDEKGMIFVPYVGLVRAGGRTLNQLRTAVQSGLSQKTLNPQVDVLPVRSVARAISVQGEVNAPGLYPIERATTRLLPMLARAGGIKADPEVIKLRLRRGGEEGAIWLQDLYDAPELNVALRPGDALIAERDRRSFTVLGAVGRQASIPFPTRELKVIEALGQVGGLDDRTADPTGIFLFREELPEVAARVLPGQGGGSERVVYVFDLTRPGGLFLARDFEMRDRDTLYATSAPFTRWQKVLGAIAPLVGFSASVRTLSGT